jgi:CheY-like chemotaxis protein
VEARQKKILIADDDADILEALTLILEEDGYAVETTSDGAKLSALGTLEHDLPDLLLLDIWMSGCNGREMCQLLKHQPQTRTLPIILFSANRETEQIAQEAGADAFIEKPFDLDDLLAVVARYV